MGGRGTRRAHRGEGRRRLRVVLKGTAPDLSHCAGAEALTKRGGGEGARSEVVRTHVALLAEVDPSSYLLPKQSEEGASPSPKLTRFGSSLLPASIFLLHWGMRECGKNSGKTRMLSFFYPNSLDPGQGASSPGFWFHL